MPTYEFICQNCQERFDAFTSISAKKGIKCPRCSSADIAQVFGSCAILLGSGIGSQCQKQPGAGFG